MVHGYRARNARDRKQTLRRRGSTVPITAKRVKFCWHSPIAAAIRRVASTKCIPGARLAAYCCAKAVYRLAFPEDLTDAALRLNGHWDEKEIDEWGSEIPSNVLDLLQKIFSPSGASTGPHIRITLTLRQNSPPRAESDGIDRRAVLGAAARTARPGVGWISVRLLSVPTETPVHLLPVAGRGDSGFI